MWRAECHGVGGVHASSFVGFAQALGYKGFKELQVLFQRRLSTVAPGFDARVRALEAALGARMDHSEIGFLRDLVVRDLTSLQDQLASIDGAQISRAVNLMEAAQTIYLLGQLRSAPVVDTADAFVVIVQHPQHIAARESHVACVKQQGDARAGVLHKQVQLGLGLNHRRHVVVIG